MAWTEMADRLNSLPLVLAGPIVRHTTKTTVSVWIAIKEPGTLKLHIFENDQKTEGVQRTGSIATVQLGECLHVALITVDCTANPLNLGILYYYDIEFLGGSTFSSTGILSHIVGYGIKKITYNAAALPSFVLPPADINSLRIAHGSCRKPHGSEACRKPDGSVDGDPDALSILDKEIGDNLKDIKNRPQLLFLTGDQIYADDVADVLLFMIQDAGIALIKLTEILPRVASLSADENVNYKKLGNRAKLIEAFKFTSGEGESHLLYLEEFYGMYLFSLSDVLWPFPDKFPSYEDVAKVNNKVNKEKFIKDLNSVIDFSSSILAVRRALANITTYMMFDDHEITDDWFFRKYWCDDTLKAENKTARRVIHNGLAAYAIFQGWGNTPAGNLYTQSHDNLPAKLHELFPGPGQQPKADSVWAITETLLLPTMAMSIDPEGKKEYHLTGGPKWHYQLVYDKFNVVVLDTRTRRIFPSDKGAPGLIDVFGLGIDDQLPAITNPASEFTIVVSPAPVMGKALIEETVQKGPSEIIGTGGVQAFLDHEAWGAAEYTFQNFLYRLLQYKKVILLSGDVHYAYSNLTKYWNNRPGSSIGPTGVILQLCSSPLKNKDGKSKFTGYTVPSITKDRRIIGWSTEGKHVHFQKGKSLYLHSYSTWDMYNNSAESVDPPDWYYENRFLVDTIHTSREINQPQPLPLIQVTVTMPSSQNRFVTQNNLGVIKFKLINNEVVVTHILKFTFNQHPESTIHMASLELPSSPFPTF